MDNIKYILYLTVNTKNRKIYVGVHKTETPETTNFSIVDKSIPQETFVNEDAFVIEKVEEEVLVEENLAARLVQDFGEFDPTLELSHYQFPPIDLLKDAKKVFIIIRIRIPY